MSFFLDRRAAARSIGLLSTPWTSLWAGAFLLAFAVALPPGVLVAQEPELEAPVPRLPPQRDEVYSPEGYVVWSYGGAAGLEFRDNIFRSDSDRETDIVAVATPGLELRSNLDRHQVGASAALEGGKYLENGDSDYLDANLHLFGRYDLSDYSSLGLGARARFEHSDIGATVDDDAQAEDPTIFRIYAFDGGWGYDDMTDWAASLSLETELYDFDDGDRVNGAEIDNDDRDRWQGFFAVDGGTYVTEGGLLYAKGAADIRRYDRRVDGTAVMGRDSAGGRAWLGFRHGQRRDPLYFNAASGFGWQDYEAGALEDVDFLLLDVDAAWRPMDGLVLEAGLHRTVDEVTTTGASSRLATRFSLGARWDLVPEVTLVGKYRFRFDDFQIDSSATGVADRDDLNHSVTVSAAYHLLPELDLELGYNFQHRNSDVSSSDFSANTVFVRAVLPY